MMVVELDDDYDDSDGGRWCQSQFRRLTSMMVVDDDEDYDAVMVVVVVRIIVLVDFLESHAHHYMNSVILMNDFMDYDGDFWNDHNLRSI